MHGDAEDPIRMGYAEIRRETVGTVSVSAFVKPCSVYIKKTILNIKINKKN